MVSFPIVLFDVMGLFRDRVTIVFGMFFLGPINEDANKIQDGIEHVLMLFDFFPFEKFDV